MQITRHVVTAACVLSSMAAAQAQSLQSRALAQLPSATTEQPFDVQGQRFDNPVIGLRLSERTRLIYEPKPVRPWADNNGLTEARDQRALGLEFRSRSTARDLRNVLRVQLSSKATLQFKPRSGGMAMSWRSEF